MLPMTEGVARMSALRMISVLFIFWLGLGLAIVKGDYYSAVSELEALVDAEAFVVEQLENYLEKAEETQNNIKRFLKNVKEAQEDSDYLEEYFGNPINAFITIRRLVYDWRHNVFEQIFDTSDIDGYKQNLTKELSEPKFKRPLKEDLVGASRGLWRLQETYKLPTSQLANGILEPDGKNVLNVTSLSASDCYIIGSNLNEIKEHSYAVEWLLEARARLIRQPSAFPSVSDVNILEQLAPALDWVGNKKLAHRLNNEILEKMPTHEDALKNKNVYESQLSWRRDPGLKVLPLKIEKGKRLNVYQRVCRGELKQSPRQQRNLRCYYSDQNVPFYRLGPFKVEQLNLDPYVAYFHKVIYDDEAEDLIDHGMGQVTRSKVGIVENSTVSEIRTSQNTWLWYKDHAWLKDIKQRLEDITGLTMESAEPLQLVNYGIGGHYEPHFDFVEEKETTFGWKGNRLLTALFYLNDVPLGGATAFPYLKLAVPAIKGSLLVWYNLHRSLDRDYRTKHAGCPVLMGSKWICNEWFHEGAQEFRLPCGLTNDNKKSIHLS